jgi:hypothetical protein
LPLRRFDPTNYQTVFDMTFPLGSNPFASPLKLYEVANNTHVKIVATGEVILFDHPDGLYSVCYDKDGALCHCYIAEEVQIVKGFQ